MHTFLRLILLALACASLSCSADAPGASDRPPSGDPTGQSRDGGLDAGPCVALGCDELGYKCGITVDNCGNELNCEQGPGRGCLPPLRCGGDPELGEHVCGCKPRANPCDGQCGTIDECGRVIECGRCADGALCLGNECVCTPRADPCEGRTCGTAPDGCGGTVTCGPSAGQCAAGTCDASGRCACRPSAEACAGRTGPYSENGCSYECGATCGPTDAAAACAGAECGTARNRCGDEVACGSCGAGTRCVSPQFVSDQALPARSVSFQGGYCIAEGAAKMVGKYALRVHAYRQAGSSLINILNRAESVSLVTISTTRAGRLSLRDVPCVAGGVGDPDSPIGRATLSSVPRYRNLKVVETDLTVSADRWERADPPHPQLGSGSPGGWEPGMPPYCVGREGQEVALLPDDPRHGQGWLPGDRCLCPSAAEASQLPRRPGGGDPNNYATTPLRDCRIIDEDRDGKPGYTAYARSLLIDSELYVAGIGHSPWRGTARDDGHHLGVTVGTDIDIEVVTLGCKEVGGACTSPSLNCGCARATESVYFVPLADDAALDCSAYVSEADVIDQRRIDAQFGAGFGSCSGPGTCPPGALCRSGKCYVQTSKGACAVETCPSGDCEPCPSGTSCRTDGSCWPTTQACPPRGASGGICEGAR